MLVKYQPNQSSLLNAILPDPNRKQGKEIPLLHKSKYSFFYILSFAYSRVEAKMVLKRLCKRGKELCTDSYLEILEPLIYKLEIRSHSQIRALKRFS